jgi:hypothetical protein
MDGTIYLGTVQIALLTGVDFTMHKDVTEFAQMGTAVVTTVLQGVQHYSGGYKKAYVDNTYNAYFRGGSVLLGSIVPRSGQSIVGSLVITDIGITGMAAEASAAIYEEGTFIMYSMTFS